MNKKKTSKFKDSQREEIAQRLVEERRKRHKTQADAVKLLDFNTVSDNSVWNRYEKGKRDLTVAVCIELRKKWGVNLNYLLAGDAEGEIIEITKEIRELITRLEKLCK